jgi:pimeloyl-ACP methyl ester carboxylesterase
MQKTELSIEGSKQKSINLDITYFKNNVKKPIIIFCHGFKGFKDWGHFNLIAAAFAKENFIFLKFSFSYNGTTKEHPADFADLEAFGENNFTIELDDVALIIDFIENNTDTFEIDKNEIYLMGHSRGGGISILKSAEDKRIKKLITWASVKDLSDFFKHQDILKWKETGIIYTYNSRTKQNMPLHFQLYENYIYNKNRLDIPVASTNINIPWLMVHGANDESVAVECAHQLHLWNQSSELVIIQQADHTFGGKHPWENMYLPQPTIQSIEVSVDFLRK